MPKGEATRRQQQDKAGKDDPEGQDYSYSYEAREFAHKFQASTCALPSPIPSHPIPSLTPVIPTALAESDMPSGESKCSRGAGKVLQRAGNAGVGAVTGNVYVRRVQELWISRPSLPALIDDLSDQ